MKRKTFLFSCFVLLFFSQFLMLSGEDALDLSAGKRSDYLVYAISASPEGKFNPLIENTQYDEYVNKLVFASLLRLNSKISLEPSLAEKYKLSKDGKTLTFILRKGLTFHDGMPLTGNDVKLSGFGNFELRDKASRPGRNPKTGESVPVSARRVVVFKPGQKLRSRVEKVKPKA